MNGFILGLGVYFFRLHYGWVAHIFLIESFGVYTARIPEKALWPVCEIGEYEGRYISHRKSLRRFLRGFPFSWAKEDPREYTRRSRGYRKRSRQVSRPLFLCNLEAIKNPNRHSSYSLDQMPLFLRPSPYRDSFPTPWVGGGKFFIKRDSVARIEMCFSFLYLR